MAATQLATLPTRDLSVSFANKYEVRADLVYGLLKETVMKTDKDKVSEAELDAFMIVCNQFNLNPFIKEIFGFMSNGKMQYVISLDGWATIINRQKELNGIEFDEHFGDDNSIRSLTCRIHRKDRALPTVVTEYFSECQGPTQPWKKWPIRMLRHKALIQCARLAFGLAGLMDEDEAERLPGFIEKPTPVLEGKRDNSEVDDLMRRLGWNETQMRMSRQHYGSDREGHVSHLKAEVAKLNRPQPVTPKAAPQPEPEPQQATFDEPSNAGEKEEEAQPVQSEPAPAASQTPTTAKVRRRFNF